MFFVRSFSTSVRHSTKAWMAKHVSDPYVRRSVKENYRARSAFKLIEINDTYKFIQPGHVVIDMGAAPGAWSQVLVKLVNARVSPGKKRLKGPQEEAIHPSEITALHKPDPDLRCGTVIALDRDPIFAIPGAHIIDDWNLTEENTASCHQRLKDLLTRLKIDQVDGILSDMCPNVTGCTAIDHAAIVILQQRAFNFARELLKPNGYFLCKLFQGQESFREMRSSLQSLFHTVQLIKPSASRIESSETYLLAMQYHGETSNQSSKTIDQNDMEYLLAEARRIMTMVLIRKTRNLLDANDQMSFFDPVYSNDQIGIDEDLLADGIPRPSFEKSNRNESHGRLDTAPDQSSELISPEKLLVRINQIDDSMEQARTMLDSMEQFHHLVPGTDKQRNKLQSILCNLEEQKTSYTDLLNLVSLTEHERSAILNGNTTDNTDDDDEEDLSLRRHAQLPIVRPRIESKIGFVNPSSTLPSEMQSSDTEPTVRHEPSTYDSLVGSLKSDTLTWRDQQSATDDDELSDDELEKNLMLQKEQFRALEGQQRALVALKERSEKRLYEQQQLATKKPTNEEAKLLWDITHLRDRLKLIRNMYERKYRNEFEKLQNSSIPTENRLKNLELIRERLDELEQLVTYYQTDLHHPYDEELTAYEMPENTPEHFDRLSTELATKRLELEEAKSALSQLQRLVKTIQPEESSSSVRSTPIPKKSPTNQSVDTPRSADARMAAQYQEIESRQRRHTIQDQIAVLHETMQTPTIRSRNDSKSYEEKLNDSRNLRPTYQYDVDGSEESFNHISIKPRMKQSNFYASDTIVGKSSDDLNNQMREICRCLSTFIEEQKSFNRYIEQHFTTVINPSLISQPTDPMFNQLQQQVVTQGLVVNLNSAYREIAVLQSEINVLQSENTRLISSISFDQQYHRGISQSSSRESIYRFRSTFEQQHEPFFVNSSTSSINSQSTGKQTAIRVDKFQLETTPIQRKPVANDNKDCSETTTQGLTKTEVQTLDLQIKSIMVQIIPYMRLHINEGFNQCNLQHLHERILFLFKQQPDSAQLIDRFENQFSQLLGKTIEKYCGTTIHECAADLIRDISDATFDELVKYKIYQNNNMNFNHSPSEIAFAMSNKFNSKE